MNKLEERVADVQSYAQLWNEYEQLKTKIMSDPVLAQKEQQLSLSSSSSLHERQKSRIPLLERTSSNNSFDLNRVDNWYCDFQSDQWSVGTGDNDSFIDTVNDDDVGSLDSIGNCHNQSSLSLLSEASLEVQRRVFAEKQRAPPSPSTAEPQRW